MSGVGVARIDDAIEAIAEAATKWGGRWRENQVEVRQAADREIRNLLREAGVEING